MKRIWKWLVVLAVLLGLCGSDDERDVEGARQGRRQAWRAPALIQKSLFNELTGGWLLFQNYYRYFCGF